MCEEIHKISYYFPQIPHWKLWVRYWMSNDGQKKIQGSHEGWSRQLLFQLSPHIFWDCTSHCTILLRNHYATQAVLKLMWLFLFLVFITLGYQASIVWSHLGNLLLWFLICEILILYGFEEKRAGKRPQGLLWHWGDSLAINRTVCSSRGPRFSFQQ